MTLAVQGGAGRAEASGSILQDTPTPDIEFQVRHQARNGIASVELHDVWFRSPQHAESCRANALVHMALTARAGNPRGVYPDVRGHRDGPIGELTFVPANLRFRSRWNAGSQKSICVQFDGSEKLGRDWTVAELNSSLDLRSGALRDTVLRLGRELAQPGFQSELMVEALCLEATILLVRHFEGAKAVTAGERNALSLSQFRRVEELLEAPGPSPSLQVLARECGVSTRHFCRMFRATTGSSLMAYAIARRIERARQLLANPHRPIKQIAWECGFQTPAAFSAAFRRTTGHQPRAYRGILGA